MQKKSCLSVVLDVKAFTLIELLVVVLIIGILAAVALPQYKKAVEKSKAVQAQTLLKTVYQAAKAYQLANGSWPTSFDELAVDIPWTGTENWMVASTRSQGKSNKDWSIQLQYDGEYGQGVLIGRIDGLYQGAGWGMWYKPRTSASSKEIPAEELICIEGMSDNGMLKPFTLTKGTYCKKLFRGKLVELNHLNKFYTLP